MKAGKKKRHKKSLDSEERMEHLHWIYGSGTVSLKGICREISQKLDKDIY